MPGVTSSSHPQGRVSDKGHGLSMTRCHLELFPLGVVHFGSLLSAGAWAVAWLGAGAGWHHSSDSSGLGNGSCWAQGHLELAQGPPFCHCIESEETDPFLHLLVEGSSVV